MSKINHDCTKKQLIMSYQKILIIKSHNHSIKQVLINLTSWFSWLGVDLHARSWVLFMMPSYMITCLMNELY